MGWGLGLRNPKIFTVMYNHRLYLKFFSIDNLIRSIWYSTYWGWERLRDCRRATHLLFTAKTLIAVSPPQLPPLFPSHAMLQSSLDPWRLKSKAASEFGHQHWFPFLKPNSPARFERSPASSQRLRQYQVVPLFWCKRRKKLSDACTDNWFFLDTKNFCKYFVVALNVLWACE